MAMDFLKFAAMAIIFGFFWNFAKGNLPDGSLRRGMSAIHN